MELCDELEEDENCNGIANEASAKDASIWYFDEDNDGYGDTYTVQPACTQPEQYVSEAGDCEDQDSGINPLMTETCNDVDDDCDGLIDEGADSTAPIGASTFYADSDGDGYGDPNATLIQCELSLGFISDNTDCKDDSAAVNPNASEYCNAVDDDCDGSIDEEDALDQSQWYADFDGDGYGTSLDTVVVCPYNKPVGYIEPSMSLDCDDANPNTYPTAVSLIGDVDGDGLDDILVGNPYEGRVGYGEVYLFYRSSLPFNGPLSASEADVTITGLWPNQHFGLSVASAGDIDGDGLDDIIGAPGDNSDLTGGSAFVFSACEN